MPRERGFTLIELVLVIVIIALIGTLAVTRIDSITGWKKESDIRRFANLWETLQQQSFAKGEGYRLVINVDDNTYYVRREILLQAAQVRQVDYLQNLRTKGQKERLRKKEEEDLKSLKDEFIEEDARQSGSLDTLYYKTTFRDPGADVRLAIPLDFPSLAKPQQLDPNLDIRDIVLEEGKPTTEGTAVIRFSPRRLSQLAVVHFQAGEEEIYTMAVHPASGKIIIHAKDVPFEEAFSDWIKPE